MFLRSYPQKALVLGTTQLREIYTVRFRRLDEIQF